MIKIETNDLNIEEVKKLSQFIKDLKKVDYSVIIESNRINNSFILELKEV